MLRYICNKPLKVIQKFHYYRIVYKFSPPGYRKYFPSHAHHKNCMQFKWIDTCFNSFMNDWHAGYFQEKLYSPQSNIKIHAITDLRKCILHSRSSRDRHVLNQKSEDILLNKCFPRFPLLLGYSNNTTL